MAKRNVIKQAAKQARIEGKTKAPKKSKYAKKHAEQSRGKYRPTSPFYVPAGQQ